MLKNYINLSYLSNQIQCGTFFLIFDSLRFFNLKKKTQTLLKSLTLKTIAFRTHRSTLPPEYRGAKSCMAILVST